VSHGESSHASTLEDMQSEAEYAAAQYSNGEAPPADDSMVADPQPPPGHDPRMPW
jgi:hypothetical protein